jgi:hypothetical protein
MVNIFICYECEKVWGLDDIAANGLNSNTWICEECKKKEGG